MDKASAVANPGVQGGEEIRTSGKAAARLPDKQSQCRGEMKYKGRYYNLSHHL